MQRGKSILCFHKLVLKHGLFRFFVGPIPMPILSLRIDLPTSMATLGKNQSACLLIRHSLAYQKSHVSSCSRQTTRAQDLL